MKAALFAALRLGALALPLAAFGQTDACLTPPAAHQAQTVMRDLRIKIVKRCYDIKSHPINSLEQAASGLAKADRDASRAGRKQDVIAVLEFMRVWVRTAIRGGALSEALSQKIAEANTVLLASSAYGPASPTGWRVQDDDRTLHAPVLGDRNLWSPIVTECVDASGSPACGHAINDLEASLRALGVVEVALADVAKEEFADLTDLFVKRARMWEAYRTQARPQYPWEWLANSALYQDRRPVGDDHNPKGPAYLPGGQLILFHPGVGLERFDRRGTSQSSSNPTLYMEWLGYNRLNWDYDAGRLGGGLGVSFLSVYAPRDDGARKWTRGIMFWTANKYGVAVTRNGEGTSIMLSVDLAELFRNKLNDLNDSVKSAVSR